MERREPKRRWAFRVSVTATLVAVLATLAPDAGATFPGSDGRIAFVRDGNIWVMNAEGTGQRRLTATGFDAHPRWSPDGRRIAFDRWTPGTPGAARDVWVIPSIGEAPYRVTRHVASERSPAWSPDGRWLVFSSDRRGHAELFKIRSTAPFGTPIRLTSTKGTGSTGPSWEDPYLEDFEPNWSPSGDRIVFRRLLCEDFWSAYGCGYLLYTVGADGRDLRRVHRSGTSPNWGPGGRRIAFTDSFYDQEFYGADNLWHVAPDGSSPVQVTHYDTDFSAPTWLLGGSSWSPNLGRKLVYSAQGPDMWFPAVYVVASGGGSAPRLLTRRAEDPDWGVAPR